MNVYKIINTQSDCIEAINRSFELHGAKPGTIEYLELEFLHFRIEAYEAKLAGIIPKYEFFN